MRIWNEKYNSFAELTKTRKQRETKSEGTTRGSIGRYAQSPSESKISKERTREENEAVSIEKGFSCQSHRVDFYFRNLHFCCEFLVNWISMFRKQGRERQLTTRSIETLIGYENLSLIQHAFTCQAALHFPLIVQKSFIESLTRICQ